MTFDHVLAVLPAFLLACVVLAALPGPATALFIHRAVRDGRSAGLAAVAGNEIGLFVWLLAGGAGVSALLVANRVLFDGMHIVGAVVLIILGFQAWRSARLSERDSGFASALIARLPSDRGAGAAFRASLVSIAANPKAAIFAISFLPQFLPRHGPLLPTLLVLATVQVTLDTLYCSGIVLLADRARRLLQGGSSVGGLSAALGSYSRPRLRARARSHDAVARTVGRRQAALVRASSQSCRVADLAIPCVALRSSVERPTA